MAQNDEVLRDTCHVCGLVKPVKCLYETREEKCAVCVDCAILRGAQLNALASEYRARDKNRCFLCNQQGGDEFANVMIFENAPNQPYRSL